MLLGEAGLAGGVGTQDWEGPGRQRGGRGRGRWAVATEGLGAEGIRRGEEGRGGSWTRVERPATTLPRVRR